MGRVIVPNSHETKDHSPLSEDEIESREFLTALANGNEKLAKLVDLRFRGQATRSRKQHWDMVQRIDSVEGSLDALARALDWLRWVPRIVLAIPPAVGLVAAVAGLLRLVGVV